MNVGFRPGCDETAVWRRARGAGTGGVAVKFFIAFDTKRKRRASRIFFKNIGFCLNSPQEETFKQREIFSAAARARFPIKFVYLFKIAQMGKLSNWANCRDAIFSEKRKDSPLGSFSFYFFGCRGRCAFCDCSCFSARGGFRCTG